MKSTIKTVRRRPPPKAVMVALRLEEKDMIKEGQKKENACCQH